MPRGVEVKYEQMSLESFLWKMASDSAVLTVVRCVLVCKYTCTNRHTHARRAVDSANTGHIWFPGLNSNKPFGPGSLRTLVCSCLHERARVCVCVCVRACRA